MGHDGRVTTTPVSPVRSTPIRVLLVLCAMLPMLLAGVLPAQAHAKLVRTSPSDGATLSASPPEVALVFNEPIDPKFVTIRVTSDGREDVTKGAAEAEGSAVYQPVRSPLDEGRYSVAYKVTSKDGHPVSGSFSFQVGDGKGDGVEPSASKTHATKPPTTTSTPAPTSTTSTPPATTSSPTSAGSTSTTSEPTTSEATPTTTESTPTASSDTPSSSSTSTDQVVPASTDDDGNDGLRNWLLPALGVLALLLAGLLFWVMRRRDRDAEIDLSRGGRADGGDGYDPRYDRRG